MISYEAVVAACAGEPLAMLAVLEHFEGYIDALCTHPFCDGGRCEYAVDTMMKTQLEGKLIHAVLRFVP